MPRELPILFNDEMVRAILDGRKTQTRRPAKIITVGGSILRYPTPESVEQKHFAIANFSDGSFARPQYIPGDLLYVRETWALATGHTGDPCCAVRYRSDGEIRALTVPKVTADFGESLSSSDRWRPSIHMPKWAARIWLRVTRVRVERVRGIARDDVRAEGFLCEYLGAYHFADAWEAAYPGSWGRNDWVWVYEFERAEAPR